MSNGPKKAITMDDIARLAEVSKPTVSRALSGHPSVTKATREKVLNVARKHGYAVNRNAQKLREKHTNTAGVILDFSSHRSHRIADPFIFELLAGVSEALSIRNQDLLLSPPALTDTGSYIDLVRARVVDGFIFLGQGKKSNLYQELAEAKIPVVVWGGQLPEHNFCTVGGDNFLGGLLAGQRFVEQGRSKVLFIGNKEHLEIKLRLDGLLKGLHEADHKIDVTELSGKEFSFNDSFEMTQAHLAANEPPDAIFAYSDTAAMAVISALNSHSLEPMKDYSLVGYNDIVQSAHFSPPITTIKQDTYVAGALLVEKYMSLVSGHKPPSSTIPTELIVRRT